MDVTFYDSDGAPIAYSSDDEYIYLYSGEPVAYLSDGSVYSYNGSHLGRFENGWIYDNSGYAVFFTENASGGPIRPVREIKPVKSVREIKPIKSVKEIRPLRPTRSLSWSNLSGPQFFQQ